MNHGFHGGDSVRVMTCANYQNGEGVVDLAPPSCAYHTCAAVGAHSEWGSILCAATRKARWCAPLEHILKLLKHGFLIA